MYLNKLLLAETAYVDKVVVSSTHIFEDVDCSLNKVDIAMADIYFLNLTTKSTLTYFKNIDRMQNFVVEKI